MSKYRHYTLREVLAEVFVDEDNDFNPNAGDSLSNSREQVRKTGLQDSFEMTDSEFWDSSMLKIQ